MNDCVIHAYIFVENKIGNHYLSRVIEIIEKNELFNNFLLFVTHILEISKASKGHSILLT